MKNIKITNHSELTFRIMQLKSDKLSQEIELKHQIKEFACTLNPVSVVKNSISELVRDKEVQFDIAKVGLNIGANFLIDKVVGRNRSIKGFLGSLLIEKISTTFINNNSTAIVSGISKLFNTKSKSS